MKYTLHFYFGKEDKKKKLEINYWERIKTILFNLTMLI